MPTAPQKSSKFHLKHYFHCICSPQIQSKGLCGDVIYEGKRIRMMVVLLLQGLYINIDMTQRRSWTGIHLEIPDNILEGTKEALHNGKRCPSQNSRRYCDTR